MAVKKDAAKKKASKKDAASSSSSQGAKKDAAARTASFKGTDLQLASPDLHDVRAHHDAYKPSAIGAKAYATGDTVSFKGGAEPTQGVIGHEAAHIVQQRPGAKKDA